MNFVAFLAISFTSVVHVILTGIIDTANDTLISINYLLCYCHMQDTSIEIDDSFTFFFSKEAENLKTEPPFLFHSSLFFFAVRHQDIE